MLGIVAAGIAVGWPALDGDYLSGDDENLIFNHALVAQPSPEHALKLFEIVHRDLYQPIPLLTFQLQFAGLAEEMGQPGHRETLLFRLHAANLLIHIINGLLVYMLIVRLTRQATVAGLAALLFIVHPLNVECFAWLNGRMIALSTTFSLATLIATDAWRQRLLANGPPARAMLFAIVAICCGVLAMMCKVRVGLGVLMVLVTLWPTPGMTTDPKQSARRPAWWGVMLLFAGITVAFLWINVVATSSSRMFEGAEKQLSGPNLARVCLALGWYVEHYLWPSGLAPWYAPPRVIAWSDVAVLRALAVLALCCGTVLWAGRKHPVVVAGTVWFLSTVATALPFVPSRNLLVADRYVYLANIGMHWVVATMCVALALRARQSVRIVVIGAVAAVLIGAGVTSRTVASYYHDNFAKISRMVAISPNAPTLQTSWGWYDFERGDYAGAVARADAELAQFGDDAMAAAKALNLRALARYEQDGVLDAALADLREAMARRPEFVQSYYRAAVLLVRTGQIEEAVPLLNEARRRSENKFNPATKLLARIQLDRGNMEAARALYLTALEISLGYDIDALIAMGEIEAREGHCERGSAWLERAFALGAQSLEGRLNLVICLKDTGRLPEAEAHYRALCEAWRGTTNTAFLTRLAGFAMTVGDHAIAREAIRVVLAEVPQDPAARLIEALLAVDRGPQAVMNAADDLQNLAWSDAAFEYAFQVLESQSLVAPDQPWPYYVTAVVLHIQGRDDIVPLAQQQFETICTDPQAAARLRRVLGAK